MSDHLLSVDEIKIVLVAYAAAMDALYQVKERIAFGKVDTEETDNREARLLELLDEAYMDAANGCRIDLRNPHDARNPPAIPQAFEAVQS